MKSTRNLLVAALCGALLIGALGISGCSNKNVVAKVNGEAITTEALDQQLEQLKKQYPNMFTGADGEGRLLDFKQRLLDNIINQKLVEQAAKDKGIKVSDADVQKQIDQLKAGFKDQAQFDEALKSAGMTRRWPQDPDPQPARDPEAHRVARVEQQGHARPTSRPTTTRTRRSSSRRQPRRRATSSSSRRTRPLPRRSSPRSRTGGDFAALAKKYSVDTATASKGGDLGWPTTAYVPEFQAALDKLKKGETTSALVQTPFGWHIIRVTDERAGVQQPLAEVKAQIEQIIVQQRKGDAYQTFLDDLRKKAKIEILAADLKAAAGKGSKTTTATK